MNTYLVGGSVRDSLINDIHGTDIQSNDKDYCVVGSSMNEMISLGYTFVGKDFPVFLHPETKDEYALARRERSTGGGHSDFITELSDVTLDEDLLRRDLSVNSIAYDEDSGDYIDPHGGIDDIRKKVLRHTSDAFREDPVRVLRLARFRATLGTDWKIAHATKALCYDMRVTLTSLTPERIWKEVEKALLLPNSRVFFETLLELNILGYVFPVLEPMVLCKEGSKHHRESSVFEHTMMMLDVVHDKSLEIKTAVLFHDVAKPHCYKYFGSSAGHASPVYFAPLLPNWLPKKLLGTTLFLVENHTKIYKTHEMTAKTIATFLAKYKTSQMLEDQLTLAHADDAGRLADPGVSKEIEYTLIRDTWTKIKAYSPWEWIKDELVRNRTPSGEAIRQNVHSYNIQVVKEIFKKDK